MFLLSKFESDAPTGLYCAADGALVYKSIDTFVMFRRLLIFFKNQFVLMLFFRFKYFRKITRVSNSLDPDYARCLIEPNLGPNCLQRLSADDTSKYRVYED